MTDCYNCISLSVQVIIFDWRPNFLIFVCLVAWISFIYANELEYFGLDINGYSNTERCINLQMAINMFGLYWDGFPFVILVPLPGSSVYRINVNHARSRHHIHIVDPSPWPFLLSSVLFCCTVSFVVWFRNNVWWPIILSWCIVIKLLWNWWRDVVREATYLGCHTETVSASIRISMNMFIFSEVMFFFGFFWSFFNSFWCPETVHGPEHFPPNGIEVLDPLSVPFLNTALLLGSSVTVTLCHHATVHGCFRYAVDSLVITILIGLVFLICQLYEYQHTNFTISSGHFSSVFFISTGFHGLHVCISDVFLLVCLSRILRSHFIPTNHVGLECAIWYWHFVDVVWVFLYFNFYVWIKYSNDSFVLCEEWAADPFAYDYDW